MSSEKSVETLGESALDESSITMLDVLEQEKELEEEYAAVLGASDEKCCTYSLGAVKRQALYSCLTCCPDAQKDLSKCGGICLACSYRCHENHELVELYTKRNFRCDCPTERLPNACKLNPTNVQPHSCNTNNQYNQNFQGLYCKCKRPYPDPERTKEEVMLQCSVCEDWFHLPHMDVEDATSKLVDDCVEMVCDSCMEKCDFLKDYTGLALKAVATENDAIVNVSVTENCDAEKNPDKSISNGEINGTTENATPSKSDEPEAKKMKLDTTQETLSQTPGCKRPSNRNHEKGATFWGNDLRSALCRCNDCLEMYKTHKVEFLLDVEDSAKSYEELGMKRAAAESSSYEQGIRALASIDRVQQIDAITEYNKMKDKLKDYLQKFAVNKQVVTEEDIRRFFEEMKKEGKANVGQPFFCR